MLRLLSGSHIDFGIFFVATEACLSQEHDYLPKIVTAESFNYR